MSFAEAYADNSVFLQSELFAVVVDEQELFSTISHSIKGLFGLLNFHDDKIVHVPTSSVLPQWIESNMFVDVYTTGMKNKEFCTKSVFMPYATCVSRKSLRTRFYQSIGLSEEYYGCENVSEIFVKGAKIHCGLDDDYDNDSFGALSESNIKKLDTKIEVVDLLSELDDDDVLLIFMTVRMANFLLATKIPIEFTHFEKCDVKADSVYAKLRCGLKIKGHAWTDNAAEFMKVPDNFDDIVPSPASKKRKIAHTTTVHSGFIVQCSKSILMFYEGLTGMMFLVNDVKNFSKYQTLNAISSEFADLVIKDLTGEEIMSAVCANKMYDLMTSTFTTVPTDESVILDMDEGKAAVFRRLVLSFMTSGFNATNIYKICVNKMNKLEHYTETVNMLTNFVKTTCKQNKTIVGSMFAHMYAFIIEQQQQQYQHVTDGKKKNPVFFLKCGTCDSTFCPEKILNRINGQVKNTLSLSKKQMPGGDILSMHITEYNNSMSPMGTLPMVGGGRRGDDILGGGEFDIGADDNKQRFKKLSEVGSMILETVKTKFPTPSGIVEEEDDGGKKKKKYASVPDLIPVLEKNIDAVVKFISYDEHKIQIPGRRSEPTARIEIELSSRETFQNYCSGMLSCCLTKSKIVRLFSPLAMSSSDKDINNRECVSKLSAMTQSSILDGFSHKSEDKGMSLTMHKIVFPSEDDCSGKRSFEQKNFSSFCKVFNMKFKSPLFIGEKQNSDGAVSSASSSSSSSRGKFGMGNLGFIPGVSNMNLTNGLPEQVNEVYNALYKIITLMSKEHKVHMIVNRDNMGVMLKGLAYKLVSNYLYKFNMTTLTSISNWDALITLLTVSMLFDKVGVDISAPRTFSSTRGMGSSYVMGGLTVYHTSVIDYDTDSNKVVIRSNLFNGELMSARYVLSIIAYRYNSFQGKQSRISFAKMSPIKNMPLIQTALQQISPIGIFYILANSKGYALSQNESSSHRLDQIMAKFAQCTTLTKEKVSALMSNPVQMYNMLKDVLFEKCNMDAQTSDADFCASQLLAMYNTSFFYGEEEAIKDALVLLLTTEGNTSEDAETFILDKHQLNDVADGGSCVLEETDDAKNIVFEEY